MEKSSPRFTLALSNRWPTSFKCTKSSKETIDDFLEDPAGRTEDEFLISMFVTLAPHFEPVAQTIATMDLDVRARMAEGGCIDDDTTGGGSTSAPATTDVCGEYNSLSNAITYGGVEDVQCLIEEAGADVNAGDYSGTPLHPLGHRNGESGHRAAISGCRCGR